MAKEKGSGYLVNHRGKWAMRWSIDGRRVQQATPYKVGTKADRARAEAMLAERTEIFRLRNKSDQLAVMIAQREEIVAKIQRLQQSAAPGSAACTLGELVEAWERSPRRRDCSATQLVRYRQQLGAFVEWAGADLEMRLVDDLKAEAYAKHLADHFSGGTYNMHINVLTAAWKAVGRAAGCTGNPWADLPRKRLETHVRRSLTGDEIAAILETAEGEWRALIVIGIYTGLRLGDACRLNWSAFKCSGAVEVRTSKTGAVVRLPAGRLLAELPSEVLAARADEGDVLPTIAAFYRRDPAVVSKKIRRIFEAAKIKTQVREKGWLKARADASYHSLRHTFVTRAIEAGVPPPIVRALVGHSTAAMTEHYTHVSAEVMEAAFKWLG
jgi:integrase